MITTGTTRVNDIDSASTFTQLAMSHDYHIGPMREFAERIHKHGAKVHFFGKINLILVLINKRMLR